MKLASLLDVYRFLNEKGYELTADKNNNNLYQCDIYKEGQFIKTAKKSYLTWNEAQEKTSTDIFNFLINKE